METETLWYICNWWLCLRAPVPYHINRQHPFCFFFNCYRCIVCLIYLYFHYVFASKTYHQMSHWSKNWKKIEYSVCSGVLNILKYLMSSTVKTSFVKPLFSLNFLTKLAAYIGFAPHNIVDYDKLLITYIQIGSSTYLPTSPWFVFHLLHIDGS